MRYLSGASTPSANNLRRIASYFEIEERDLFLPHSDFSKRFSARSASELPAPAQLIIDTFKGSGETLREYVGFYHSYYVSPSWQKPVCCLVQVKSQFGFLTSKTIERSASPFSRSRNRVTYQGVMTSRPNVLILIENSSRRQGAIMQTIFNTGAWAAHEYLRGQVMSVTWKDDRTIFSTPLIWKRIPEWVSAREALEMTGPIEDSNVIPSEVRDYLKL